MKYTTRARIAKQYNLTNRQCQDRFKNCWKHHPAPVKKIHNESFYDKDASDQFLADWHKKKRLKVERDIFAKKRTPTFEWSEEMILVIQFLQPGVRTRLEHFNKIKGNL